MNAATRLPAPQPQSAQDLTEVPLDDLVTAWLDGRSPATLRAYEGDLRDFQLWLNNQGQGLNLDLYFSPAIASGPAHRIALAYRADLIGRGLSPATIGRRLAALRSLARLARQLGRVPWLLEVEGPRAEAYRDTRGPGADGWRRLLAVADAEAETGQTKPVRDRALVRLLHDLGLRRGEAVRLDTSDVEKNQHDGPPTAVWVWGKGRGQSERLTVPGPTAQALAAWLAIRPGHPGPVFVRLDQGRTTTDAPRPLTGEGVRLIVRRLGRRAELVRPVRPHGLRHQAITRALEMTDGNLRAAQRFARHRNPATTVRYDDNRQDVAGQVAGRIAD